MINKPAGLLIHKSVLNREDLNKDEETLVDWLLKNYPQIKNVGDDIVNRPGIVHRLDRETSGVMIIPLNQKTFDYFKKLFSAGGGSPARGGHSAFGGQVRGIKKTYIALVYGNIKSESFVINKPIGIKSGTTRRSVHCDKMAKEAVTEFEVVKRFRHKNQDLTLLKVYPKTGRTHQIRVHLAYIHCPVVGDKLYGRKNDLFPEIEHQFLHAESIEFEDSKGKVLKFKAGLPRQLNSFLKSAE